MRPLPHRHTRFFPAAAHLVLLLLGLALSWLPAPRALAAIDAYQLGAR